MRRSCEGSGEFGNEVVEIVAAPVIVTVALPGVPTVAPAVGSDSMMLKALLPENAVASLTGTTKVFEVASPSFHSKVPLVAV